MAGVPVSADGEDGVGCNGPLPVTASRMGYGKLGSLRVLGEAGVAAASHRTLKRRLTAYAEENRRQ